MPWQTTKRGFATCLEESLLTRGGWRSLTNAAFGRFPEYRTALITAAVTGKIDVRHISPKESA